MDSVVKTFSIILILSLWIISTSYFETLGILNYLIWIILIIITKYTWSLSYSILIMISTLSYNYMDIESKSIFISEMLPLIFGISGIIIIVSFFKIYMPEMNKDFHSNSQCAWGWNSGNESDGGFDGGGGSD